MASTFAAVSPRIWDAAMRRLSFNARYVRAYIATCPTKTTEGLFALNVGYVMADTGLGDSEVRHAIEELEAAGLVGWDATNEVVLDYLALEVANINSEGDKRIAGALKQIRNVGETSLRAKFADHAERVSPVLAAALRADATPSEPMRRATSTQGSQPYGFDRPELN